jgi:hypothetical protein
LGLPILWQPSVIEQLLQQIRIPSYNRSCARANSSDFKISPLIPLVLKISIHKHTDSSASPSFSRRRLMKASTLAPLFYKFLSFIVLLWSTLLLEGGAGYSPAQFPFYFKNPQFRAILQILHISKQYDSGFVHFSSKFSFHDV